MVNEVESQRPSHENFPHAGMIPPYLYMPDMEAGTDHEDDLDGAVHSILHPPPRELLPSEQWCEGTCADEFVVKWLHPDTLEPVVVPEVELLGYYISVADWISVAPIEPKSRAQAWSTTWAQADDSSDFGINTKSKDQPSSPAKMTHSDGATSSSSLDSAPETDESDMCASAASSDKSRCEDEREFGADSNPAGHDASEANDSSPKRLSRYRLGSKPVDSMRHAHMAQSKELVTQIADMFVPEVGMSPLEATSAGNPRSPQALYLHHDEQREQEMPDPDCRNNKASSSAAGVSNGPLAPAHPLPQPQPEGDPPALELSKGASRAHEVLSLAAALQVTSALCVSHGMRLR